MTLYPYRELTITSKVQECYEREFAAKLGEFDYRDGMGWATNAIHIPNSKKELDMSGTLNSAHGRTWGGYSSATRSLLM